jgi:hypothetical protein
MQMKAVVVYESLWGNTAAIARAIAEGIGPEAQALSTAEATPEALQGVDLIVGGSPLFAFRLPTDEMRENIRSKTNTFSTPPDLSAPSMRDWLETVPTGQGQCAGFETRIWLSPGSAAKAIQKSLEKSGYAPIIRPKRFRVTGMTGPLKAGEIERARKWGARLARNR